MISISFKNVSVDIPILEMGGASLRRALLNRTIGGRFSAVGSHLSVSALKNISFEAHDGDRIALVGNNGSGKSSLLRVLSHVYPPTGGQVSIKGSIVPIFDATLGMSMDATGLENIQICGTIWGLSPNEIKDNLDDIIEFTELGGYINVPVRTYSTGMMLRLAFAIATAREPEILLIDEIIGVGDKIFFEKAFKRLRRIVQRSRILFVASHADEILRQLCNKALWLEHGNLMKFGDFEEVVAAYRGQTSTLSQKTTDAVSS